MIYVVEKCSAETVYKLAKVLGVSMEMLTVAGIQNAERERAYEYGLPEYLQHDLDAYKEGHTMVLTERRLQWNITEESICLSFHRQVR